jgi:hypothetical protein
MNLQSGGMLIIGRLRETVRSPLPGHSTAPRCPALLASEFPIHLSHPLATRWHAGPSGFRSENRKWGDGDPAECCNGVQTSAYPDHVPGRHAKHQATNRVACIAGMETALATRHATFDGLLQIVSVGGDRVTNFGKQPRSKSCTGNIDRNRKIKNSQNEPSR